MTEKPSQQDSRTDSRTIVFVFAGREKFMRILMKYLRRELAAGVIDEVHLWNCCRNQSDSDYLQSLASSQIKVMGSDWFNRRRLRDILLFRWTWWRQAMYRFREIFRYYLSEEAGIKDNDVLIRIDDDVVYVKNLQVLRDYARAKEKPGLTYPCIVNNDVGATWQIQDGLLDPGPLPTDVRNLLSPDCFSSTRKPLSEWAASYECASVVHEQFLSNPAAFTSDKIHVWDIPQRLSVNSWAVKGVYAKLAFGGMRSFEEGHLTHVAPKRHSFTTAMVMQATTVHFSFGPQEQTGKLAQFLPRYESLAEQECPEG